MSRVVVLNHLTLDGVMQGPGRPDEDRRDGFTYGGWAEPDNDAVMGRVMQERYPKNAAVLLGRRTYEDFASYWPQQGDNPFTTALTNAQKYVASTTLREPLSWVNSTLLQGDAAEAVARLKASAEHDFAIFGSGQLVQSLMRRGLIDEFVLMVHPVVLGEGRRLFVDGGAFAALRHVDTVTTSTGVVIAVYQPAEPST